MDTDTSRAIEWLDLELMKVVRSSRKIPRTPQTIDPWTFAECRPIASMALSEYSDGTIIKECRGQQVDYPQVRF